MSGERPYVIGGRAQAVIEPDCHGPLPEHGPVARAEARKRPQLQRKSRMVLQPRPEPQEKIPIEGRKRAGCLPKGRIRIEAAMGACRAGRGHPDCARPADAGRIIEQPGGFPRIRMLPQGGAQGIGGVRHSAIEWVGPEPAMPALAIRRASPSGRTGSGRPMDRASSQARCRRQGCLR